MEWRKDEDDDEDEEGGVVGAVCELRPFRRVSNVRARNLGINNAIRDDQTLYYSC